MNRIHNITLVLNFRAEIQDYSSTDLICIDFRPLVSQNAKIAIVNPGLGAEELVNPSAI